MDYHVNRSSQQYDVPLRQQQYQDQADRAEERKERVEDEEDLVDRIERTREEARELAAEEDRMIDRWVAQQYGESRQDQDRDLLEEEEAQEMWAEEHRMDRRIP